MKALKKKSSIRLTFILSNCYSFTSLCMVFLILSRFFSPIQLTLGQDWLHGTQSSGDNRFRGTCSHMHLLWHHLHFSDLHHDTLFIFWSRFHPWRGARLCGYRTSHWTVTDAFVGQIIYTVISPSPHTTSTDREWIINAIHAQTEDGRFSFVFCFFIIIILCYVTRDHKLPGSYSCHWRYSKYIQVLR